MSKKTISCLVFLLLVGASCFTAVGWVNVPPTKRAATAKAVVPDSLRLKITANGQVVTARFVDSETTRAFIKLLPLKLLMSDLDGREKYSGLPVRLPTEGAVHTAYQTGDISYWLGGGLAAFYHQDGHQVKAGLVVLARLESNTALFAGPGPVQATFEAVAL